MIPVASFNSPRKSSDNTNFSARSSLGRTRGSHLVRKQRYRLIGLADAGRNLTIESVNSITEAKPQRAGLGQPYRCRCETAQLWPRPLPSRPSRASPHTSSRRKCKVRPWWWLTDGRVFMCCTCRIWSRRKIFFPGTKVRKKAFNFHLSASHFYEVAQSILQLSEWHFLSYNFSGSRTILWVGGGALDMLENWIFLWFVRKGQASRYTTGRHADPVFESSTSWIYLKWQSHGSNTHISSVHQTMKCCFQPPKSLFLTRSVHNRRAHQQSTDKLCIWLCEEREKLHKYTCCAQAHTFQVIWGGLRDLGSSEPNRSKPSQSTYRQGLWKVHVYLFHGQDEDQFEVFWALLVQFGLG